MKGLKFLEGPAATALRVQHLLDLLTLQLNQALAASGCSLKGTMTGVVLLLDCEGVMSVADIAGRLGISHQLATQRINALQAEGLAEIVPDELDKRRREVALTAAGKAQGKVLQKFLVKLEQAYESLFAETGINLLDVVDRAESALTASPLGERMAPQLSAKQQAAARKRR